MADFTKILNEASTSEHSEKMFPVSSKEFDHIIQNRRSVRLYSEEKIPVEVVNQVLDWALLAPNSSNLQAWGFYWVKDPQKKSLLVEALLNQPAARTAQELIVAVARRKTWKKRSQEMLAILEKNPKAPQSVKDYYSKITPLAYNQGPMNLFGFIKKFSVAFIGLVKPIPREPTSDADMRVWAVKSTALACENIMLGFSAFGFDSCPMEGYDSKRIKKILNIGPSEEVVMVISAGKRDKGGVYGPRIRMPREEFIKTI